MRRSPRALRMALASFIGIGLVLVLTLGTASAHAKVIDSTPKMNSTIPQAPTTITVKTAENMKPGAQFSNLFVYGPDGALVSQGDAKIPLNSPEQMSVTITPEKNPGIYVVRWITVSADDGDPDQGAFVFTVNPAGAAAATPAPTKPAPAPNSTIGGGGISLWIAVVVGVIALLIGLGGGVALGRRGTATTAPATSSNETLTEEKKTTPTP